MSVFTLFAVACQPQATSSSFDEKLSQAPDYSKYTDTFEAYAYSGPSNGTYKIDGVVYDVGKSFMTYERYVEYKEAGFTIYLSQHTGVRIAGDFNEDVWAEEKIKMDAAYEAGLKILLTDQRLLNLSKSDESLLKENEEDTKYQFETEADLDAYVQECIALYKDHPGFYGLQLGDEPRTRHVTSYGEMYRAIKRALPDIFVQYNLLPMNTSVPDELGERIPLLTAEEDNANWTDLERQFARYEKYLNTYLDVLPGVGYLQYDVYPIQEKDINIDHIRALQIAAKVCKERGIELHIVSQTMGMYKYGPKGTLWHRSPKQGDLQWMNNLLLGFGVKQINSFTYMTKGENSTTAEYFIDGASFISYSGEKTKLYYWMQEIMANNQKFAPTIKQFAYQGSRSYTIAPTHFNSTHAIYVDNSYTFKKLKDVSFNKEVGFVSELYDSENNNYMYMIMNLVGAWNEGSRSYQVNTVTFSDEYTHVVVYKNGVGTPQKLDNGKLTVQLAPGEAVFALPY